MAFLPESFWYIQLALSRPNDSQGEIEETKFNWKRGHLFDHQAVTNLFAEVQDNPTARVEKVTNKATKKWYCTQFIRAGQCLTGLGNPFH